MDVRCDPTPDLHYLWSGCCLPYVRAYAKCCRQPVSYTEVLARGVGKMVSIAWRSHQKAYTAATFVFTRDIPRSDGRNSIGSVLGTKCLHGLGVSPKQGLGG